MLAMFVGSIASNVILLLRRRLFLRRWASHMTLGKTRRQERSEALDGIMVSPNKSPEERDAAMAHVRNVMAPPSA